MLFSPLQKYILSETLTARKKLNRARLVNFYERQNGKKATGEQVEIITKSLERLIVRGLLTAQGIKTSEKFFIQEIILTREGKRAARELLGKQQRLKI